MTKRIVSMLLVLVMVLSTATVGVSAVDPAWGGMTDRDNNISGAGTEADPFIIDTPQKLAWLSYAVENPEEANAFLLTKDEAAVTQLSRKMFSGYYFKQTADIDLNNQAFMPIGTYYGVYGVDSVPNVRHLFGGHYDGNGYKIMNAKISMEDHLGQAYTSRFENLYIDEATETADYSSPKYPETDSYKTLDWQGHYDALFNVASSAIIKNIHAVNVDTGNYDKEHTKSTAAAIIVGHAINGAVTGCTTDVTSSVTATTAGGIVCRTYTVKDTRDDASTTLSGNTNSAYVAGKTTAGGIVAISFSYTDVIDDNENKGRVEGGSYAGGIAGRSYADVTNSTNSGSITSDNVGGGVVGIADGAKITACENSGAVNGATMAGGILGNVHGLALTITNSKNTGAITGNEAGGILGQPSKETTVNNCQNTGAITAGSNGGGIVGKTQVVTNVTNCVNNGAINATSQRAAGIIGSSNNDAVATVTGCVNNGDVTAKASQAGGIIGYAYGDNISNCVNNAAVSGGAYVGGIAGALHGVASVKWTVNNGSVTATKNAGGIAGWLEPSTSLYDCSYVLDHCVNTGTMIVNGNQRIVNAAGIVAGSDGIASGKQQNVEYSYCYNLVDTFYITYTYAKPDNNYVPCGGGLEGLSFVQAGTNSTRSYDNCYSVAGKIMVTEYGSSEAISYAWENNQYPSTDPVASAFAGLLAGVTGATRFANANGLANTEEATIAEYLKTCRYGMTVAEIEADSTYQAILAVAGGTVIRGTWGGLTWTLDQTTGELTISGTGGMGAFASSSEAWSFFKSFIKSAVIEDGVTDIGMWSFAWFDHLASITIPNSVKSIDFQAFSCCESLETMIYCGTEEQWNAIPKGEGWNSGVPAEVQFHNFENDVCTECGATNAHTHEWGDGVVTTQPTCTDTGVKTFTCACGETKTEVIEKLNSLGKHNYVSTYISETCTTCGYFEYVCRTCGHSYIDTSDITAPRGHVCDHDFISPTCTEEGYTLVYCTIRDCDYSYIENVVPATGHVYSDEGVCAECGATNAHKHEWDDGVITTEPTYTTEGVKTFTCPCGETKTESIPPVDVTEASPMIGLDDVQIVRGQTVTVPVWIKNNPGVAGIVFTVSYNTEAMTLIEVTNGSLFPNMNVENNVVLISSQNICEDGVLVNLVFEIPDGTEAGDYTVEIKLRDCQDEELQTVDLALRSATLTVIPCVYGDANGDCEVTLSDAILVRAYLANYNYDLGTSTVSVEMGADANGDGAVNLSDAILLSIYLANYDYDTGSSSIVLGPQA